MESESELRARIDKLTTSIYAQKRVLRDLETQRSNARSKLNSSRDPMAGLPVEISAEIFLHCLPTDAPEPNPHAAPILLLNVSHLWRNIGLSAPALWSRIRINSGSSEFFEFCRIWIGRARSHPLSFAFRSSLNPHTRSLLQQYGQHLQDLELFTGDGADLEQLKGPFPGLKTLTICADPRYVSSVVQIPTPRESVEILRAAPQLLECDFDGVFYDVDIHDHPYGWQAEPSTHKSLLHLRLGTPQGPGNSANILQYLTLPALKSLRITDFDITNEDFIAFLTRSAPPLESLSTATPTDQRQLPTWVEIFRLIPGVADLDLELSRALQPDNYNLAPFRLFLAALGTQNFLPNLHSLTLRIYFPRAADYEALIFALRGRRARLQSFQLIFPVYHRKVEEPLDGGAIAALQQLAEEGMQIHVGPSYCNFV
ncbi:hypothetical protein DFH06DRAFT_1300286 [Mycena polygramma]|nr:hypothetical protein DFH06DRAFT_1300286 [Mycena polygramma]